MTTVMKSVETMLNHRFAVMPMERYRIRERDRLVGHLGEDPVARGDQDVDREAAGDPGVRRGQPGQRMSAQTVIGRRGQRIRIR